MTHKRFFLELLLALVGYAAAVLISGQSLAGTEPGAGRVFLALLPVPPMVALALVVIRYLRRLDEMARRIHLEALALAFVGTALLTFTYGFLETTGFPETLDVLRLAPDGRVLGHRLRPGTEALRMRNRVRELRAERGWSQAELAGKLEVSRQTVNAIETGRYDPSLPLAFKLARVFGLAIEAIFDDREGQLD